MIKLASTLESWDTHRFLFIGTSLRMSLSRVNIKEANDHLKQVHQRVYELENQVHMQAMHAEELQKSNLELQHRLQEVLRQKEEAVRAKEAEVSLGMSTCAASLIPRRSQTFPLSSFAYWKRSKTGQWEG